MKKYLLPAFAVVLLCACKKEQISPAEAESASLSKVENTGNIKTRVLNNTLNFPWEILWGPDNFIWFTEREGRVKKMDPASGQTTLIANITEVASTTDFNGLLGMVLHPQFSTNPYVYVVYNYFNSTGAYMEKVVRFTYDGFTLTTPMIIVDGIFGRIGGSFIHNGS